jgi:hypothetical protein
LYFAAWDYLDESVIGSHEIATTPLKAEAWKKALVGYTDEEYLGDGLRHGFRLGLANEKNLSPARMQMIAGEMLPSKVGNEVLLGRILGPFRSPPLVGLHVSPLSVIEKKVPGKYRLIHNLSAPRGKSVNDAIPGSAKSVAYCKVSQVVDYLLRFSSPQATLTKFDIKDAFRIVPVNKADWRYLGMAFNGAYFVDTVLPMGCATSCAIFQSLTRAICWLLEKRFGGLRVFGYLDDFLLVSPCWDSAMRHAAGFRSLCIELGIPIADEKTVGPCQRLSFLGIGLDIAGSRLYLEEKRIAE